jgi:translation initiation factor 2B subunit (eIF-2B alpha/beta/delta family)
MVMRILTDTENQAINEELQTLESSIEKVANILANKKTPYFTAINAEKLLETFVKVKNHLLNDKANNKLSIIQRLPLLYLQIHKLGVQNVK